MRTYDPAEPLFVIHLPKTAGISVRTTYQRWFQDRLLLHYYDEATGRLPPMYDLDRLHSPERPVALYGHFNNTRGFGLEQYYPNARQFITILREPFERALSGYFFVRKHRDAYRDQSRVPQDDVRDYLLDERVTILNHFPAGVTLSNFKELIESLFIEIGVVEHLEESMVRIARKIGMPYTPGALPRLNATERDRSVIPHDLKEMFMSIHPLDYAIYNHVLAQYSPERAGGSGMLSGDGG